MDAMASSRACTGFVPGLDRHAWGHAEEPRKCLSIGRGARGAGNRASAGSDSQRLV